MFSKISDGAIVSSFCCFVMSMYYISTKIGFAVGVSMICLPVSGSESWAGAVNLVILQILAEAEAALLWPGLGLLEAVEAGVRLEEAGAALVPLLARRLRDPAVELQTKVREYFTITEKAHIQDTTLNRC